MKKEQRTCLGRINFHSYSKHVVSLSNDSLGKPCCFPTRRPLPKKCVWEIHTHHTHALTYTHTHTHTHTHADTRTTHTHHALTHTRERSEKHGGEREVRGRW
jgi:hypothetical protein